MTFADALPAVLIVNDEPHTLIALTAALEGGPWRIVSTGSGLGAFKQLLFEDFAAIILDVQMPGLNGFEVAEMIRSRPRCAATPIIFCSARAQAPDDQFKGYELGAVDYLLAPVAPRTLRSKVGVFAELYEHKRQLARTIAELQQARQALELRNHELTLWSTRDALTGCLSRRGFVPATAPLFDAARGGAALSIVAVDVDRMEQIAATHGRKVADACVRRVSRLILSALRDHDEVCRWRAEQFVVALGGQTTDAAVRFADRLAEHIRDDVGAGLDTPGLQLTASIGVASAGLTASSLRGLAAQAAIAVRAARQAGGDTVRRFDQNAGDAA